MDTNNINSPLIQDLDDMMNVETIIVSLNETGRMGEIKAIQVVCREKGKEGVSCFNTPIIDSIIKYDSYERKYITDIYGKTYFIFSYTFSRTLREACEFKEFYSNDERKDMLEEAFYKYDLDNTSDYGSGDCSEIIADFYCSGSSEIDKMVSFMGGMDGEDLEDSEEYKAIQKAFFDYQVRTGILEE